MIDIPMDNIPNYKGGVTMGCFGGCGGDNGCLWIIVLLIIICCCCGGNNCGCNNNCGC